MTSRSLGWPLLLITLTLSACAVDDVDGADDDAATAADGKADNGVAYVEIGGQDTYLKKRPVQASELTSSEKCVVPARARIELQGAGTLDGSHVLVNTRELLAGCGFSRGYLYVPHIARSSFRLTGTCAANVSASACALLGTIAFAEGTNDRYDVIFGYQYFTSYANHPRRLVCSGGYCSDAAGRYQFLSTTWDAVRSGLPDFGPASQDLAALRLVRNRGVTSVDSIDTYAEFSRAIYALNLEWASLPGSPYGQPTHSVDTLWAEFRRLRGL